MDDAFEPGQRVTIHGRYDGPKGITTVEKLTHGGKRVVTVDGRAWNARTGHVWGSQDRYYMGDAIYPMKPGDAEVIERRRHVIRIRDFAKGLDHRSQVSQPQPYSTEALRAIVAAIDAAKAGVAPAPPDAPKPG